MKMTIKKGDRIQVDKPRQVRFYLDARSERLLLDRSVAAPGPSPHSPSSVLRRIVDRYAGIVRHHLPSLSGGDWDALAVLLQTRFDHVAQVEHLEDEVAAQLPESVARRLSAEIAQWSFVEKVAAVDEIERRRLRSIFPTRETAHGAGEAGEERVKEGDEHE